MRGNAGTLVVLAALSGCAVVRDQDGVDRLSANPRGPSPAAQTAWKQYNMMAAQGAKGQVVGGQVEVPQSAGTAPQSPWPSSTTPGAALPQPNTAKSEQAVGTLVSATFVETPRDSAGPKGATEPPVVSKTTPAVTPSTSAAPAESTRATPPKMDPPTAPALLPKLVQTTDLVPPPEPPLLLPDSSPGEGVKQVRAIVPQTPSGPSVRMVNSKRINLNYELKDVGESGVSGIELWYTQDTRTWKKYEGPVQTKAPYCVDVHGEGLYGFTMVARSGVGFSRDLPQPGELPQVWVEVDLSRPVVQVTDIRLNSTPKEQKLLIQWTASDKNLTARPITLSCAEKPEGPWTPIAANLENSGKYEWPISASVPQKIYVKVEAADLVGHIGSAQTVDSVLIDRARPRVSIMTVDSEKMEK